MCNYIPNDLVIVYNIYKQINMKNVQIIKLASFQWININNPTETEIQYLRENFNFHPLDYEDVLSPLQRPKLDDYQDYIFMVLAFPFYDRTEKEIKGSEIDIFIGHDFLITCSDGNLEQLNNLFWQCKTSDQLRQLYTDNGPTMLLYHLINKLQHSCLPMMEHISADISEAEKKIFSGQEKEMVRNILMIKRNINHFRKIIRIHKNVLQKLLTHKEKYFIASTAMSYFGNLVEQTKEIWDGLDNLRETVSDIHSTNESLISFRLNDIMRTLTIFSVIFIPINFIAALFTIPAKNMPLISGHNGFWVIVSLIICVVISLITIFKSKKWL